MSPKEPGVVLNVSIISRFAYASRKYDWVADSVDADCSDLGSGRVVGALVSEFNEPWKFSEVFATIPLSDVWGC